MSEKNKTNPKPNVPSRRTAILVLGMHRSGTSALCRVLSLLGCDLPKTLDGPISSNETGHLESSVIIKLNDRILASAGSKWSDWQKFDPSWFASSNADEFRNEAVAALQNEYGDSRLFVLKDPRICRLAGFWTETFKQAGVEPLIITSVRNPLEVAYSLERRNGFVPALGHLLWLRHVLEAEHASRGLRRFFTSYNQLMTDWSKLAEKAQTTLRISFPKLSSQVAGEVDSILLQRHRHYREPISSVIDNPKLSNWVRDTFAILDNWATNGENVAEFDALDRIKAEYNAVAPTFGQLVAELQQALDTTREGLAKAEAKESEVFAEKEMMLASASWRLTAPTRAIHRLLRPVLTRRARRR